MLVPCLWMSEAEETLTTLETSPMTEETVRDQLTQHEKYNDRKAMAGKGNYFNEDEKKKWMGVLKPEIMSSDESCCEDDDQFILVHPVPWLSAEVTAFKQKLDEEIKKEKSPRAQRQTKRRVIGCLSSRSAPTPGLIAAWAV
ncbi:hypothetical protein GBAR_LOCUS20536, partial [Geodia barretti]